MKLWPDTHVSAASSEDRHSLYGRLLQIANTASQAHPAVIAGNTRITYSQLLEESIAFGRDLARAGIPPGTPVAILLPNGVEFLVAAFGIWAHGAVALPLGIQLRPPELRAYLLEHSIATLITSPRAAPLVHTLIEGGARLERVWYCSNWVRDWTCEHLPHTSRVRGLNLARPVPAAPSPAALTQYSTGSTGRPRSITRSHQQMLGEVDAVAATLGISDADRIVGLPPFHHSYGLMVSALTALLRGATLYVPGTFLPSALAHLIARERISGFPGVPTMFQLLCEQDAASDFSSLRFILSAGAPLGASLATRFRAQWNIPIRQLYGTTETGVVCIGSRDDPAIPGFIGPPIHGVSLAILDDADEALPLGQAGLVCVSSPYAAHGYNEHTETGESKFLGNGFVPGDLGHLLPTGELVLCGRQRRFINVNGLKVDPGEVERTLLEIPGVSEAAVLGVPDDTSSELVKAVLVTATPTTERAVRAHCATRLAAFKCPRIIEFRSELPRSPIGKLLRKDLL